MRKLIIFCVLLFSFGIPALAATGFSTVPILVDLNVGESQRIHVPGSRAHVLRLLSYKETTAPYFSPDAGKAVPAIVSATAKLTLDGKPFQLVCGPYRMPVRVADLKMMLTLTRHWTGGIDPDLLRKDVRLEVQSAFAPWINVGRLYFPIRNYRWRASNYQHTYLGVVVNQPRLYYHRGEDLGMIPDLGQALAMTGGVVAKVPGPTGDGGSDSVIIENGSVVCIYDHMNAPHIRPELQPGDYVTAGEVLGLTGNTWEGQPVDDPHLHVEVRAAPRYVFYDSFTIVATAYRETFPNEVLPVAGSPYLCYAGQTVKLDGENSLPPLGSHLVRWLWKFTDGSTASGPIVEHRFNEPGGYSEQMTVTDAAGHSDSDFAEVFVLSRNQHQAPPYIWISYYPVRPIYVNEAVRFRIRYAHVSKPEIDFGDGARAPWSRKLYHSYSKPGTYVVTVHGADTGSGPGTFKVRVIVEKSKRG